VSAPIPQERSKSRLDQWLWFARFAKTRSLAARLCAAGVVAINGVTVSKANQTVRTGDVIVVPQGGWQHTVRVVALGLRRGPATEARLLYEAVVPTISLREATSGWAPLLDVDDPAEPIPQIVTVPSR